MITRCSTNWADCTKFFWCFLFLFTDAPQLNTSCWVSERWIFITWEPPPMTYDILTNYNVWRWNESSSKWRKSAENENQNSLRTSRNLTDLGKCVFRTNIYLILENSLLSNKLIKVELPPWKIWKADVSSVNPFVGANDEGLTFEASTFQIFHAGNSTFINSFDKANF